jgi:hypothetical protein
MDVFYNCDDFIEKVSDIQHELSLSFIKTGTYASIIVSSVYLHTYNKIGEQVIYPEEFSDGYWKLVIDIDEFIELFGSIIKPKITQEEVPKSGRIRLPDPSKFPTYVEFTNNKYEISELSNLIYTGGRLVLIIFRDGSIKRVPSEYVSLARTVDLCKGLEKIIKIVEEHFANPGLRSSKRTEQIKEELYERTQQNMVQTL